MSFFDSLSNLFEGALDTGFDAAVAPIAPVVKQVERYEGTHFNRPSGPPLRQPAGNPDYFDPDYGYGHFDIKWVENDITSTWVPHQEMTMDDEWFDYDFEADSYAGGGDESWGVNPISVDGAITSAIGGVGSLIGGGGGGGIVPAMGVMPLMGAAAAGAVSLGARLAGMFGKASGSFIINGIKGNMASLWPLVRKYGPAAVAGALGIGAASLAELLMRAPTSPRHRRRGISARDVSTTKRVVRFTNRMARSIGCVSRPRSRYRPRGGGRHYH